MAKEKTGWHLEQHTDKMGNKFFMWHSPSMRCIHVVADRNEAAISAICRANKLLNADDAARATKRKGKRK